MTSLSLLLESMLRISSRLILSPEEKFALALASQRAAVDPDKTSCGGQAGWLSDCMSARETDRVA